MPALIVFVAAFLVGCSTSETLRVAPASSGPPPLASVRYAAMVVDGTTGTVLFDADGRAPRYPASLTKMMTLFLLFEAMEQGRVSRDTRIPVSGYAAGRPPTKIGFRPGDTIDVDSAIRALIVKSANDVAVAVAEYLGGSEEQFAAMMTARARALGMAGTTFRNASGLPDSEQRTTARDMALLGMALRRHFPQYFPYFANRDFTFRGRPVRGHNDLLGRVEGVDGIKTGYVRASGFNIVTSVSRGGRRLVVVVMGGTSARERNAHVEQLIERFIGRPRPLF